MNEPAMGRRCRFATLFLVVLVASAHAQTPVRAYPQRSLARKRMLP